MNIIGASALVRAARRIGFVFLLYATNSPAQETGSSNVVALDMPVTAQQMLAEGPPKVEQKAPILIDTNETQVGGPEDGKNRAMVSAVADGATTSLAISAGGLETNPLISASPIGLVALTAMKIGVVQYADTLPQDDKRTVLKSGSALWGGAAVNNLMVFLAAPPPFPIVAGLIMGILTWTHMDNEYEREDILAAATKKNLAEKEKNIETATLAEVSDVEN